MSTTGYKSVHRSLSAEEKNRWVEALRSGQYKQGRGKLFNAEDQSYCCLGVLCDIRDSLGWKRDTIDPNWVIGWYSPSYGWFDNRALLGEHFGIPAGHTANLAFMNDDGISFEDIADYIEESL